MNFELASMTCSARWPSDKTDLLLVLVPDGFKPQRDGLSKLIGDAMKSEGVGIQGGQTPVRMALAGVAAQRLVLAGIGDGSPSASGPQLAVAAAMAIVKSAGSKRLTACAFPGRVYGRRLRAAVGRGRWFLCLHHDQVQTGGAEVDRGGDQPFPAPTP
jgi:leucyl aminopeptidase